MKPLPLLRPLRSKVQQTQLLQRFTQALLMWALLIILTIISASIIFHFNAQDTATASQAATILNDIPYGEHILQRMDVILPAGEITNAPIIAMVHGGDWAQGDKTMAAVTINKIRRWQQRGVILVFINYRLLPQHGPETQSQDIAQALAAIQSRAVDWHGDPGSIVLMGHSAGGHLAALLSAAPERYYRQFNLKPWLGSVLLDAAVLDAEDFMQHDHARLYDRAFGLDKDVWAALSPYRHLSSGSPPTLLVCSSTNLQACARARRYADKSRKLGNRTEVIAEEFGHAGINRELGKDMLYTQRVERFLISLDDNFRASLQHP